MHPSRQLAVWALGLACSSTLMAQQPRSVTKGDEQGLTPFAHADLAADRQAVDEAVGGWWTKAQRNVNGRTRWFRDAHFGCFVHWGVYSQAAGYWQGHPVGGYSEHLMRKAKIPLQQYKKALVSTFDPIHFDAEEWMQRVADAGMRYFVITAKHHDGFAMYPSAAYPYDIRLTRCKRDPMMELREAARRHGIKFGFYYSHAFDWEHPCAPGNDWEYDHPGGDRKLGGTNWWNSDYKWFLDSAERYVAEKSIPQIKELIKTYQPDILWFDTPGKLPLYLNIRILKAIRDADTQLSIVVNGRLVRWGNRNMGDYRNTGDRAAFFPPTQGLWESIPTTNESYGYNAADNRHKPVSHFVRLLEDAVSRGGNILMNVGPMGDGRWDEKDVTIFKGIGRWLKTNGESIYGADRSGLPLQSWGVTTMRHDTLYLHIHRWPANRRLTVGGLNASVERGWTLDFGQLPVGWRQTDGDDGELLLPDLRPDTLSTVVALKLRGKPVINPVRLLDADDNCLYTFDASLEGKGLGYGDGKPNRNYVFHWTDISQAMRWEFRTKVKATYEIYLDYNTEQPEDQGCVSISIGQQRLMVHYKGYPESKGTARLRVGRLTLPPGQHTCRLQAVDRQGQQYMRPIAIRMFRK